MSDFKWSAQQEKAIFTVDSNVLLSAGAGSGKTAVLTERIYQLVKKGFDLSRFLILTFTNAASAEMKTRIRKAIMSDASLGDLSSKIETAHIETFDAFALFLVKKYSFRLGISPNVKIIDNTLLAIKRNRIRDEVITHLYDIKDNDFLYIISRYCTKNDVAIRDFITSLCVKAEMQPHKKEYLNSFIDKYYNEGFLNHLIDEKYHSMVEAINLAYERANLLEDPADASLVCDYLDSLLKAGKDYDSLVEAYSVLDFPKKSPKSISNKAFRDYIKNELNKVLVSKDTFGTRNDIISDHQSTKEYVNTLIKIVSEIEEQLDAFKKDENSYSFSDIAFMALNVLDIPEVRQEMSEYFQFILVDEYQDTSALQELVINKLERNNVCMVGDIKQSIYRFRNADCTIFQNKFDLYSQNKGGKLIDLNTSYRSRKEVVDIVNEMFSKLMVKETNPIDYQNGHIFEYGFTNYDGLLDDKEDYLLKVYRYLEVKGKLAYESESEIIALDIINKINKGYKVFDKEINGLRPCEFKDFAIIVDKGTYFEDIKTILSNNGLPVRVVYNESVKESLVVTTLKNLLILLNGMIKDEFDDKFIHSFVAISRGFLCEKSDQEIYDYVMNKTYLESELLQKVKTIKEEVQFESLEVKLNTLIDEFHLYNNIIKLKHFSNNANKVQLLVDLVKGMDEIGFSLDDLISYFEDLNNFDLEIDYSDKDVSDNSITLITIHRSKGLEYPIVYLPLLTSSFLKSPQTSFLFDDTYGPLLPNVGVNQKTSLLNHLMKINEAKGQFEERLRLFYVAVTRARERLIMLYRDKEKGDDDIFGINGANSYRTIVHYLNLENEYGVEVNLPIQTLKQKSLSREKKTIEMRKIQIPCIETSLKKASKEKDETISEDLLEFGNEIHYMLEIADYETKDLSFITNGRIRKYISNVVNSEIFKNVKNNQVLHEYSFFDEKNGVHGIIDCLVIKDDEIDIIDFKLKNIEDEKYVLQLHTYRDYISQISSLPIRMYLISAIKGEVKEIE